jgi:hypothetical protein
MFLTHLNRSGSAGVRIMGNPLGSSNGPGNSLGGLSLVRTQNRAVAGAITHNPHSRMLFLQPRLE